MVKKPYPSNDQTKVQLTANRLCELLLKAVVNHRWFQFSDMLVFRHWATDLMSLFHSMLFFPIFQRDVVFFLSLGRVMSYNLNMFFFLISTKQPPLWGDGENAISNFSLLECLCISLWKAVGLFFFFWGFLVVQPDDGEFCWGLFFQFFVQRKFSDG